MENNLIGIWKNHPDDIVAQEYYGNVTLDFRENGNLIYTIFERNKVQQIFLTYEVHDNTLITDQQSKLQKMETKFSLDITRSLLVLYYGGVVSKYKKIV